MEIERSHTKHIHRISCVACKIKDRLPSSILKLKWKLVSPASLSILKLKQEKETLINASNSNGQEKEYIYIHMY